MSTDAPTPEHQPETDLIAQRDRKPLWGSWGNVAGIQSLNAFNDNVSKFLLIGLASTTIGEGVYKNIAFALMALAFILFAPVAGWASDRFSKRRIMILCLWIQLLCLGLIGLGPLLGHFLQIDPTQFQNAQGIPSLGLVELLTPSLQLLPIHIATIGFFLICIQSAFFGPAKLGVVIELIGRRRLGMANSWMQMLTMIAIIIGAIAGGEAFAYLINSHQLNPWLASTLPLIPLLIISLIALYSGYTLCKTPATSTQSFSWKHCFSHIGELKILFADPRQGRSALVKAWTWFIAVFVNLAMLDAVREVGVQSAAISSTASRLVGVMGIGIIIGSILCFFINRRRNQLGLIPIGALLIATLLLLLALQKPATDDLTTAILYNLTLVSIGISSAFLLIPLSANLQSLAPANRRGAVMAGSSMLDSSFQLAAAGMQLLLSQSFSWSVKSQLIALGIATLIIGIIAFRHLSHATLVNLTTPLFRALWRIRVFGAERFPNEGGVLLTPNHVSYVDAFILSAASPRPIRFVLEEKYYNMPWAHWFLKWMGSVPITQRKAKDAMKTVAEALNNGDVVCIFPEGELTRDGQLRDMRRGFELIARRAKAPVLPVSHNGMFRSLLAHSGGGMIKKMPRFLRVSVSFGHPLKPKQATVEQLTEELTKLRQLNYHLRPKTTPDSHPNPDKVIERQPVKEPDIPYSDKPHRDKTDTPKADDPDQPNNPDKPN